MTILIIIEFNFISKFGESLVTHRFCIEKRLVNINTVPTITNACIHTKKKLFLLSHMNNTHIRTYSGRRFGKMVLRGRKNKTQKRSKNVKFQEIGGISIQFYALCMSIVSIHSIKHRKLQYFGRSSLVPFNNPFQSRSIVCLSSLSSLIFFVFFSVCIFLYLSIYF